MGLPDGLKLFRRSEDGPSVLYSAYCWFPETLIDAEVLKKTNSALQCGEKPAARLDNSANQIKLHFLPISCC